MAQGKACLEWHLHSPETFPTLVVGGGHSDIMGAPMSTFSVANPADAFLSEHDFTAVSFWIISIAMIAATVFFYAEAATVSSHWRTSLHVGGLVTLVAAVHYMYMREYWVSVHASPIVYRYIDWSITVPLQMIEFNLILKAAKAPIGPESFWKLLLGTVVMLAFGYAGESKTINPWVGFACGMAGWGFILFEIFAGDSSKASGQASGAVQQSFNNMRIIVSLGWAIYPAGYFLGQINNSAKAAEFLNVTYNIADFVNKIAFVLACWSCAKEDSDENWADLRKMPAGSGAKGEAAAKIISNHSRLVNDICNGSPITQPDLRRVGADGRSDIEQMMQEVAARLLGHRGMVGTPSGKAAAAWKDAAAYLKGRAQSSDAQCPGRKPDMSPEAAREFMAAVNDVAGVASEGSVNIYTGRF